MVWSVGGVVATQTSPKTILRIGTSFVSMKITFSPRTKQPKGCDDTRIVQENEAQVREFVKWGESQKTITKETPRATLDDSMFATLCAT